MNTLKNRQSNAKLAPVFVRNVTDHHQTNVHPVKHQNYLRKAIVLQAAPTDGSLLRIIVARNVIRHV